VPVEGCWGGDRISYAEGIVSNKSAIGPVTSRTVIIDLQMIPHIIKKLDRELRRSMTDIWNSENEWVLKKYHELLNKVPLAFDEVQKKMPKTGMVYMFSFEDGTPAYVGVTVQKGGRMSSHRHNPDKGVGLKLRLLLEAKEGKSVSRDELHDLTGRLGVRWIDEADKGNQERIEHLVCALLSPPLNCQGRKGWGAAKRSV